MKTLLRTTLFLLFCFEGKAQDWQPFIPGMKYFYHISSLASRNDLEFFHIDSVYHTATDTIYLNNAQHYKNDTCAKKHTQVNGSTPYYIWTPDKIIKSPQYWKFNYSHDSWDTSSEFYIPVQVNLNDSWTINDSNFSITCTCHSIENSTFLSVTDSVKRISCISGTQQDEIILSKQHGLLKFFHPVALGLGVNLRLAGFSHIGNGAGIRPLSIREAFLAKPGDVLYYRNKVTTAPNQITFMQSYKDSILNINITQDSLHIAVYRTNYHIIPSSPLTSYTTSYTIPITTFDQEFYSPLYSIYNLNDPSSDLIGQGISYEFTVDSSLFKDGIVWRKYITDQFHLDRDNCKLLVMWDASKFQRKSIYTGDIYSLYCGIGSDCYVTELIGLRIGNKSYGQVNLALNEEHVHSVQVFPNPASEKLFIHLDKQFHYLISNLTGKTISAGDAINEIDISSLPSGFYVIEINGSYRKFIKQ